MVFTSAEGARTLLKDSRRLNVLPDGGRVGQITYFRSVGRVRDLGQEVRRLHYAQLTLKLIGHVHRQALVVAAQSLKVALVSAVVDFRRRVEHCKHHTFSIN